jgi:hypothetical protein
MTENLTINNSNNVVADAGKNLINGYVVRFQTYANKSAENVLEMCKVVHEAYQAFANGNAFDEFCKLVGLQEKSAISKMKKIGSRYAILKPYMDRLPSAWTTLYKIAKMTDEQFQRAIDQQKLSIYITAKQLGTITGTKANRKLTTSAVEVQVADVQAANENCFKVKLGEAISTDQRASLEGKLAALCREFGVELIAA